MVVLYVTLFMRVTMRRSTRISAAFNLLRMGSAGTLLLAAILSCSDNTTAPAKSGLDPNSAVIVLVPDSVKAAVLAQNARDNPLASMRASASANLLAGPAKDFSALVATPTYVLTEIPFAPEPAPGLALPVLADDGFFADVPIGFAFKFYGNTYDKLNIDYNGFVSFGVGVKGNGFFLGDRIADPANPNNIIALAWSDWRPDKAPGSITYETRGIAPNRHFLVQFTGVPENAGSGRLTAQLVLTEGSNDITVYVTSMSITNGGNRVTQGIENADGTEAAYDSVENMVVKVWAPRVRNFFNLSNDAIRFSLNLPNVPPVITAPADISVATDPAPVVAVTAFTRASVTAVPGSCASTLNPGTATATGGATITGVRSDDPNLALDAPYPKGVTKITWTARSNGMSVSAIQTITVIDSEKPLVAPSANISTRTDRGQPTATVAVADAGVSDNCPGTTVAGSRNDGAALSASYPLGVTTINWKATDASGNIGSAAQTVTVIANAPPTIVAPPSLTFNTDPAACSALVDPGSPTVTDDTPGATFVGARSDGAALNAAYPKGVTTIMWTATDADGAKTSAPSTVTVNDRENPLFTAAPANISTNNDPGAGTATVAVASPPATDTCHSVAVNGARSDGLSLSAGYPVGTTTINWTASDPSGNASSVSQTVTVRDITPPSISLAASMTVNATMPSGAVVDYSAGAMDNVHVTSFSCTISSGSVFPIGVTQTTCTAADAAGNSSSATLTVTVLGAHEQIGNLIDYLSGLNLPNGTSNPLLAQLNAAYRSGDNHIACTKMSDFISMLAKKTGTSVSGPSPMLTDAQRIENVLGC
jgi:hypothetical protein